MPRTPKTGAPSPYTELQLEMNVEEFNAVHRFLHDFVAKPIDYFLKTELEQLRSLMVILSAMNEENPGLLSQMAADEGIDYQQLTTVINRMPQLVVLRMKRDSESKAMKRARANSLAIIRDLDQQIAEILPAPRES